VGLYGALVIGALTAYLVLWQARRRPAVLAREAAEPLPARAAS
jgi:hypothetical protein